MTWQNGCAVLLFMVLFELWHRHGLAGALALIWRFFIDAGELDSAERRARYRWRNYGRRDG